jgi:hypothetical protein
VRVEVDPAARERILHAVDELFGAELGPAIAGDAKRYVPKDTHALEETIDHHVEDHTLIVSAGNNEEVDYAAYVELGHRVAHGPGMSEVGPKVVAPQPYLRPALYTERGE